MDPPAIRAAIAPLALAKPRLRGVWHEYAFFVSLACGAGLILTASGDRARLAATIYAGAVSGLLGTSALYHRVTWRPTARRWMKRLDHSMIFVLIAGTYTPVALLALKGQRLAVAILIVVWAGALGGMVFKLAWIDAPKWLLAAVYVALGSVTAAIFGELPATIGWLGVAGLGARRTAVHRRRADLCRAGGRTLGRGVRLPRGLPCVRDRRRRPALRGDCLRGSASGLSRASTV